jgi:hypothetical protein
MSERVEMSDGVGEARAEAVGEVAGRRLLSAAAWSQAVPPGR